VELEILMATAEASSGPSVEKPDAWYDVLLKLAGLAGLTYAYLFFVGCLYVYMLYASFHVEVWTLELPVYIYPVMSIPVIFKPVLAPIFLATLSLVLCQWLFPNIENIYWLWARRVLAILA
jgi:hypothetical protein